MSSLFSIWVLIFFFIGYVVSSFYPSFDPSSVAGLRVVVTGATAGIGRAIALHYASLGAKVIVVARTQSKLESVVREMRTAGARRADYIVADLGSTEENSFSDMVRKANEILGGLDTLILNHVISEGTYRVGGFYDGVDMASHKDLFNVNFFSYVSIAQFAMPYLEPSKGKIVVLGSLASLVGLPNVAPYAASKHAIVGYFSSLRVDLMQRHSNVSITTCFIGSIDTDSARRVTKGTNLPDSIWASPQQCAQAIISNGECRVRDMYFPIHQTYPLFILRMFPAFVDFIVDKVGK